MGYTRFEDALKSSSFKGFASIETPTVVAMTADTAQKIAGENFVQNSIMLCNLTFENGTFTVTKSGCMFFVGDANLECNVNNTKATMLLKVNDEYVVSNFLDLGVQDDTIAIGANKPFHVSTGDTIEIWGQTDKNCNLTITGLYVTLFGFVEV